MNRRERMRRCYFNEEIDRPAVFSRILFPPNDPTYDKLKAYLDAHSELKLTWDATKLQTPYPTDVHTESYSDAFERRIEVVHTPKGDLRKSTFISLKNQPPMHETYLLNNPEDAEKYLSLSEPKVGGDVSGFFAAEKKVGDKGIVNIFLGVNPGGTVASLFGTENFAIMTAMERDLVHTICEREKKILINLVKFLIDRGIGPFFGMEGEELIVPPLHGPVDSYDFNVKYDKPVIDLVHNAGGRMHIHCHASIKKVLPGFVEMGVDVLHPFEAPPMGDVTPKEAKEIIRNKMCYEGNLQINRMYEFKPKDIAEEVKLLIADVFDDHKGLIVSPTASPYIFGAGEICFPQYKTMVDTVLAYKG